MTDYAAFTCAECDHTIEVRIIRGEYPSDDYAELPEACEACGASLADHDAIGCDDSQSERQQMGITD